MSEAAKPMPENKRGNSIDVDFDLYMFATYNPAKTPAKTKPAISMGRISSVKSTLRLSLLASSNLNPYVKTSSFTSKNLEQYLHISLGGSDLTTSITGVIGSLVFEMHVGFGHLKMLTKVSGNSTFLLSITL